MGKQKVWTPAEDMTARLVEQHNKSRGQELLRIASENHIKKFRHTVTVDETNMTVYCAVCNKEARVITIKGLSPYLFEYVNELEW